MVAINVQAGVGAHLLDRDPEQAQAHPARHQADQRRGAGRPALDPRRAPQPRGRRRRAGGADAEPARARRPCGPASAPPACGLALDLDPAAAALPASVDATGYRIVREALTNVLRHASSDEASVRVTPRDGLVVIEVENDGVRPAYAAPRPGARHRQRPARHARAGARRRRHPRGRAAPRRRLAGGRLAARSARPCDPGAAGRRPDAGAGGVPRAAGVRGRPGGGRRGGRRCRGRRAGRRDAAGRRADGHPDAQRRRARGHPAGSPPTRGWPAPG